MTPDLPPDPPGRWLSRKAAMAALGVTERTLQRRMRDGRVLTRQVSGNHVQVYVPDRDVKRQDSSQDSRQDTALAVERLRLAEVADRFLARNAAQEALIRQQAEQIGALRERLRLAEEPPAPWWRGLWQRLSGH